MRRIIDNIAYDTDKAERVAAGIYGDDAQSAAWCALYRTELGGWFEVEAGHNGVVESLRRLDDFEARVFRERYANDRVEEFFGAMPEAGPMKAALTFEKRRMVIAAATMLKELGHSGLDRFLLELGTPDDIGKGSGLAARTTSLARYVLNNPESADFNRILLSDAIIKRAKILYEREVYSNTSASDRNEYLEAQAIYDGAEISSVIAKNSGAQAKDGSNVVENPLGEVRLGRHSAATPLRHADLPPAQLEAGIVRLEKQVEALRAFDPDTVTEQHNIPESTRLHASIDDALMRTFGADTHEYERYKSAAELDNGPFNYAYEVPIHEVRKSLARSKAHNVALLEQAIASLRERFSEANYATPASREVNPSSKAHVAERALNRRVFVVHGHDEGAREMVAAFLRKADFDPIVLHEQASQGRTVIEKVEAHSDVDFAVVLLTPDDFGGVKGEDPRPRARQNVVLELGYFVGKLGRQKVCALRRGQLEIPSDFGGFVYTEFDAHGGWRQALGKELEAAGYYVDWKKAMS